MRYLVGKWMPQCCLLLAALGIILFLFTASCCQVEVPWPLGELGTL